MKRIVFAIVIIALSFSLPAEEPASADTAAVEATAAFAAAADDAADDAADAAIADDPGDADNRDSDTDEDAVSKDEGAADAGESGVARPKAINLAEQGMLGFGAYLGVPLGISLKLFFSNYIAMTGALGLDRAQDGIEFSCDIQFHLPKPLRSPGGRIAPFAGVGLFENRLSDYVETAEFSYRDIVGFRFPLGLIYRPIPWMELGLEVTPCIATGPDYRYFTRGGLTVRFFFTPYFRRDSPIRP